MDLVTIETGLLHDLVEDTRMTPDEIRKGFGEEVARCVDGVIKLSKLDIFNAESSS
jgi:GTP pyrophosphokinase